VKANHATQPVRVVCLLVRVSASGFYAWRDRPISARRRAEIGLSAKIHEIHLRAKERYGSPNIHAELEDEHDVHARHERVARLMREAGLKSIVAPTYVVTTTSAALARANEDLVNRRFKSKSEARMALFEWIEGWYNPDRGHSSIGRLSPNNCERRVLAGKEVRV
jgi:putative transposase